MTSLPDSAPPAAGPYLQTVSGRWVNPLDPRAFLARYAQLDARRQAASGSH